MQTEQLVELAYALRAEQAALDERRKEVETAILALGAGKHTGSNAEHVVTVIAATDGGVKFEMKNDDVDAARELLGEDFKKLFDRAETYKPCKSFCDVLGKLVKAPVRKKILALTERPTPGKSAYLRFA